MLISLRIVSSVALAILAISLALLPRPSFAATASVSMGPSYFTPSTITIQVGDSVLWQNTDSMSHTVTANDGTFNSGTLQGGATYSRTFTMPGAYSYHCDVHSGMFGTINVVANAPTPVQTVPAYIQPTPPMYQSANSAELRARAEALLLKVQQLQGQLGASGGTTVPAVTIDSSSCPNIGRSLRNGSSGDDVTRLQQFLARDSAIYPEALVTGFYGSLTEAAVKRWQARYNVVSSGTPDSTGYGVVGPRTAAAIAILCSTGSYNGIPGPSGSSAPVGGFIQVTPVTGNAPLTVAVQVTVNTVNSCAGATYTLNWGDGTQPALIAAPAGQCTQMTQTLGHTYGYGGTYQLILSAGGHQTSATVQAYGSGPPSPTPTPTPTPTAASTSWGIVSVTPAVGGDPFSVGLEIDYPACAAYSIDWGDGSLPTSVSAQSGCGSGAATATANHTYSLPGTYTIYLRDGTGATKAGSAVTIVN